MRLPSGLAFLGMDEEFGGCPHCGGYQGLVYSKFNSRAFSCETCVLERCARNNEPEPTWIEERKAKDAHIQREIKRVCLEVINDIKKGLGSTRKVNE